MGENTQDRGFMNLCSNIASPCHILLVTQTNTGTIGVVGGGNLGHGYQEAAVVIGSQFGDWFLT